MNWPPSPGGDSVESLALDRSAADFSAAGTVAAATADSNARTLLIDSAGIKAVDVIVELTNLGSGPATKLSVVGRSSGLGGAAVATATDWSTINTEALDTATGVATITPYIGESALAAVGRHTITFPVKGRYFSALVWVDSAAGTRGNVYFFRR